MNFQDLYCFMNKLKVKQSILEKNESDFIKLIKENYGIDIAAEFNSLKTTREQELHVLKRDIRENVELMNTLKQMLMPENLGTIDIIPLKDTMLALENSIITAKSRISNELNNLIKLENNLTFEITNTEMKYADGNKNVTELNKIKSIAKPYIENQNLYQEVKDFATFVAETGGHEGGWTQNDHVIFIRNYNKIKNTKKLINAVHSILPDISEERISLHIKWYKKYMSLRAKQKEAIENWRKSKTNRFEINLEENTSDDETKKIIKNKTDEERQQIKEKIEKWKKEKEQNINKLISGSSTNSNNSEKHKISQEQIKKEILKWKTLKQSKLRIKKLEKELNDNERKSSIANKLIKEFQNQDNKFIERRMNTLKLKAAPRFQIHASKDLSRKRIRNPERVYRATKQWISRISRDESKETFSCFESSMSVRNIPKLATPAWRLIEQRIS